MTGGRIRHGDGGRDGDAIYRRSCSWYALCDHPAVGVTPHPILGAVPICQRCADRHDLAVAEAEAQ